MAKQSQFASGLVPAVGPDGAIKWQAWTYSELVDHLQSDLTPGQYDANAVAQSLRLLAAWHPIPFNATNWQNFGASFVQFEYMVSAEGIVYIHGLIKSVAPYALGTPATLVIGTLPAGARPAPVGVVPGGGTVLGTLFQADTTPSSTLIRVDVQATTGIISIQNGLGISSAGNNGNVTFGTLQIPPYPAGA